MSDKKTSSGHFADLFREEAAEFLNTPAQAEGLETLSLETASAKAEQQLVLSQEKAASEEASKSYWRGLRAFFRNGEAVESAKWDAYPALLASVRNRKYLSEQFPNWMSDSGKPEKNSAARQPLLPLFQLLNQAVETFAPGAEQARILKDNLPRLMGIILQKLQLVDDSFKAYPVLEESLDALVSGLAVKGEEGEAFVQDVGQLKKALPKTGVLIPSSTFAPLHLLAIYLSGHLSPERRKLREEIQSLLARLKGLLAVEQEKSPEARSPEKLQSGMSFAGNYLNFDEFSALLPADGAERMPQERQERIAQIVATLEQADSILFDIDAHIVLGHGMEALGPDWDKSFPHSVIQKAGPGQSCAEAMALFDQRMVAAARLFGALRMGRLEEENRYVPEIHADFFAHLDWRQFSEAELATCPPTLLVADAFELLESEMDGYSRLLASGRPLNLLLLRQEERLGQAASGAQTTPFRPEPGALAIAHRNVYFFQGAALQLDYWFKGVREAFSAFSPAILHLLIANMEKGGYLGMSAAVEGREFPGFTYDSRLGPKWGSRFDIHANPQPENGWPEHELVYQEAEGQQASLALPFTFADFAVQHPGFYQYFQLVPSSFWNEDLVPLSDFLALPTEQSYSKVPYIWVADGQNQLQKAAVAWPVVLACRERLDFWRYLQENAGIHSYHVDMATERLRQELSAEAEAKLAEVKTAHQQELEKTREESARQAMEQLADVLLGLEPLSGLEMVATPSAPAVKAPASVPPIPAGRDRLSPLEEQSPTPEPAKAPEPEEEEEEALPLGEAWIETPQCTSCNECTSINNRIFKYNADGQAYIADPQGGTFEEIVRAAESCPARIIHPGAPQDPNEPGLDKLAKRAEPFN